MECARFDWKAYALGDLSVTETAEYERHAHNCDPCRAEFSRWQPLVASLRSLPQAEPPRRIVFAPEPDAVEPWWQRLWHSGPQLGFASAAVLALAIVTHGLIARVPVSTPQSAGTEAGVQASVHEATLKEVNRLLPQAVDAALAGALSKTTDQRLRGEIDPALASFKRQLSQDEQLRLAGLEQKREADQKAVRYAFERLERRVNYVMLSSARPAGDE